MLDDRRTQVRNALRLVLDPEIGASIVDLGLVYRIDVTGDDVAVDMTLTAQGCPLGDAIVAGARSVVERLPWVGTVAVQLVWSPPWSPDLIDHNALEA